MKSGKTQGTRSPTSSTGNYNVFHEDYNAEPLLGVDQHDKSSILLPSSFGRSNNMSDGESHRIFSTADQSPRDVNFNSQFGSFEFPSETALIPTLASTFTSSPEHLPLQSFRGVWSSQNLFLSSQIDGQESLPRWNDAVVNNAIMLLASTNMLRCGPRIF